MEGRFIDKVKLTSEICDLFKNAKEYIVIVCPFFGLQNDIRMALRKHIDNSNIKITLLYGKLSNKVDYVLNESDLDFLKKSKNIEIYYHPELHAKYYANEQNSIFTTLNLNMYCHKNVEYGICFETNHQVSKDVQSFISDIIGESKKKYACYPEVVKNNNISTKKPGILEIKEKYTNAYERWSSEDDLKLEEMFCKGADIDEISSFFKRQPSAISARLVKLEFAEKYTS